MKTIRTPSNNQSSDKLLKLVEFLATQGEPLRLVDISKALEMNNSTTLRFLTSLMNNGYLAQEPDTSKYYLTYKFCAIGVQIKNHMKLNGMIYPSLREVARETGETTCLAINQNNQVVYINVVEAPGQVVKTMQRIGNIAPIHCTGIGKLFLSNYSEEQIDNVISKQGLKKFTDNTITTKSALLEETARIRQQGYAIDNEECEKGTRCVAFPIYDYSDRIIAGFSITGPSLRITDYFIEKWTPFLKEASSKLSNSLGYEAFLP